MSKINEECGVFGIISKNTKNLALETYYGLFALQHRGQEACGIAINNEGLFKYHKDLGLVNEVITPNIISKLGEGQIAVGHVRYSTSGVPNRENAQPMVVNHSKGHLALVHNGNLVNSFELRNQLENEGCIFQTTTDTEVISYILTRERIHSKSMEEALEKTMSIIDGAYSLVLMTPSKLICCKDPYGFRPLCYGITNDGDYVIASESCALDATGAKLIREIEKGEIVVFHFDGTIESIKTHVNDKKESFCIFEYIYFARPDSIIDNCYVHQARYNAGRILAKEHPVNADIVIGVPDSGLDAAIGYANESGIPYEIGLLKNKYVGRSFIASNQKQREQILKVKLNPIKSVIQNKRVVLVDDSIVRGTTSARLIKLVKEAGAKEVHMRLTCPPFIYPCYYGTDVDSQENLIAYHHTIPEIAKMIKADSLGYLSIEALEKIVENRRKTQSYCKACFDGKFPTKVPINANKNRFEEKISKEWKKQHSKKEVN